MKSDVPLTRTGRGSRPPQHLADLDPAERRGAAVALGEPAYRAEQLSRHYFARLADDAATMTDIPTAARGQLAAELLPPLLSVVRDVDCDGGTTRKTLWRGFDGVLVESVLMRYPDRTTVCVSSQAGCGMGCPFCATGQGGLRRNLSTAEIVEQVVAAARVLDRGLVPGGAGRVDNVVFMGMGEPLANYRAVLGALRRLTDLVPVNRRWPVAEVLAAMWDYARRSSRRVSIEYALIRDINDQPERAELLGRLLRGQLVHVNLIPLNPTPGSAWTASRPAAQREFVRRLRAHRVATTVRDTRGREIAGACGQLSASEEPQA